jgi:hypothetical protein
MPIMANEETEKNGEADSNDRIIPPLIQPPVEGGSDEVVKFWGAGFRSKLFLQTISKVYTLSFTILYRYEKAQSTYLWGSLKKM